MVVDGFEVFRAHFPLGDTWLVHEAQRNVTHQIFDKLRVVVGALGNPFLVRPLQQAEHLAGSFLFGDPDQFLDRHRLTQTRLQGDV